MKLDTREKSGKSGEKDAADARVLFGRISRRGE